MHLRCQDKCGARLVSLHIIPSPLSVSSSVQTNETETEIHIWRNMAGARYKLSRRAQSVDSTVLLAAPLGVTFSPSHMEYQSCVEHAKWW